ncbi:cysteine rich repeat-containing protein [Methylococcus sp. ANG]|uniref:cysteine rich repeat-containing protein n=1 Tax=unclassified Methylococcus TaxID=2618889 RepID=UPI001C52A4F9|nr:cysteine rich repeat-containing protein [Methylococcus sp. Mc7]QXP82671.1 cysteine rich repeat-containing protein [Methylococcus sp. Mc7]
MRSIASNTGIGRLKRIALLVFLAGAWAVPGHAAPHPLPCSDEIARYCKNLGLGGGRIQNCLKEHQARLSPACRSGLESALARHREIQAACGADVERLCGDVRPGKGRVAACLREHHRQVSSACKDTLAAARKGGSRTKPTP